MMTATMETQNPAPTVLVAEDESAVRMLAVEVLQDCGYAVREARDGVEALEILQADGIDLLITDIQMPRMNGHQLAATALAKWPNLKILLVTGYAHESTPAAIAAAGVRTLRKPFDIDRLPVLVGELLAHK
jgi:CheY-like chemotaxis protein